MIAIVLTTLLLQSAPPRPPQPPRHIQYDLPRSRWAEDMRTKNIEDVLALYTPDAVFVQPDGSQVAGAVALRKLYTQVFSAYDAELHFGNHGLTVTRTDNDLRKATESGDYNEDLTDRATKQRQHICGRYTFVWRQQPDDRWLLSRMEWTLASCPAK